MKKKIVTIVVVSIVLTSCAYNKNELPKPNETGVASPGGIPTITYTSHAKAIIDAKCIVCHSAGGTGQPPFLDTYSTAFAKRVRIEARAIIQGTMAPGNPLPQTEKDTLQMWIDQGALQ